MDQMVCFEAQRSSPLLKRINDFASLQLIYTDKFFLQLGIKHAKMSEEKMAKDFMSFYNKDTNKRVELFWNLDSKRIIHVYYLTCDYSSCWSAYL